MRVLEADTEELSLLSDEKERYEKDLRELNWYFPDTGELYWRFRHPVKHAKLNGLRRGFQELGTERDSRGRAHHY